MAEQSPAPTAASKSRFFIALIPPSDIQSHATQIKEYFRDHYRSKAALKSPPHITLQAPFEWPDDDCDRLLSALSQFQFHTKTVPVNLSGFGAFPPRVIYVNVDRTPELMQLQAELSRYLASRLAIVDPRSRDRPFRPHLTVAFRDLKPAAFRLAWPEFEHQAIHFSFASTHIALLRHTGREWVSYQQFSLQ